MAIIRRYDSTMGRNPHIGRERRKLPEERARGMGGARCGRAACSDGGRGAAGVLSTADVSGDAVEAPVTPTVHPTLVPTSAIDLPLNLRGDTISVWRQISGEQRLLLQGHARAVLGYRVFEADSAAVTLTPTKKRGATTRLTWRLVFERQREGARGDDAQGVAYDGLRSCW